MKIFKPDSNRMVEAVVLTCDLISLTKCCFCSRIFVIIYPNGPTDRYSLISILFYV